MTSAWSLSTRLMVRIFADIASVRAGVSASFKKKDAQATSAAVAYCGQHLKLTMLCQPIRNASSRITPQCRQSM